MAKCYTLYSELDAYRDSFFTEAGSTQKLTPRGKIKWALKPKKLKELRGRVDSVILRLQTMMQIHSMHSALKGYGSSLESLDRPTDYE